MPYQIVSHTPLYVWAILAFLVYRGVAAMRTREITVRRLFVIPLVMLALSLQDIALKFGLGGSVLAVWGGAAAAVALLAWRLGGERIAIGAGAGRLRIAGSRAPLVMMLGVFAARYALSVTLAVQPQLVHEGAFVLAACGVLGLFNGYFLGRLARDLAACRLLFANRVPAPALHTV